MKHRGIFAFAIGLSIFSGSLSPATAGDTRSEDLALLVQAQRRVSSQIAAAGVQRGSAQYTLLAERRQLDGIISALEAGEDVEPERIERALKRARVIQ